MYILDFHRVIDAVKCIVYSCKEC